MPIVTADWLQYGVLGLAAIVLTLAATMVRWVMNASSTRERASTDREKYFFSQMEQQRVQFMETIERQRVQFAQTIDAQRESHAAMLDECRVKSDAQITAAYAKYDALSASFGRVAAAMIDVADKLETLKVAIDDRIQWPVAKESKIDKSS